MIGLPAPFRRTHGSGRFPKAMMPPWSRRTFRFFSARPSRNVRPIRTPRSLSSLGTCSRATGSPHTVSIRSMTSRAFWTSASMSSVSGRWRVRALTSRRAFSLWASSAQRSRSPSRIRRGAEFQAGREVVDVLGWIRAGCWLGGCWKRDQLDVHLHG